MQPKSTKEIIEFLISNQANIEDGNIKFLKTLINESVKRWDVQPMDGPVNIVFYMDGKSLQKLAVEAITTEINWINGMPNIEVPKNTKIFAPYQIDINKGTIRAAFVTADMMMPNIAFPHIKMPKINKIFPQMIASELCSVQPMSGPVGQAFAMRYKGK